MRPKFRTRNDLVSAGVRLCADGLVSRLVSAESTLISRVHYSWSILGPDAVPGPYSFTTRRSPGINSQEDGGYLRRRSSSPPHHRWMSSRPPSRFVTATHPSHGSGLYSGVMSQLRDGPRAPISVEDVGDASDLLLACSPQPRHRGMRVRDTRCFAAWGDPVADAEHVFPACHHTNTSGSRRDHPNGSISPHSHSQRHSYELCQSSPYQNECLS
jgi:hypothetical protein